MAVDRRLLNFATGGLTQREMQRRQTVQPAPSPVGFSDPTLTPGTLGSVALTGATQLGPENFRNIEELVQARTDPALNILEQGAGAASELSRAGRVAATQPLEQFGDLTAFNEQQAILGSLGPEAQEAAIGNIPVSQFDRELQRRQTATQRRQAAAVGERGSGAALLGAQQLAGGQQADIIQQRLSQLEPLVAASRGVRSTLSGIDEAAAARQAQIQSGLGVQQANIRLGTTAPIIESRLGEAELSGLRGISAANQRGQLVGQLTGLASQFAPQIQSAFAPTTTPTAFPEAGRIGVA